MPSAMSESAHTSHPTFHNDTHTTFPSSATTATDVPGSPPRKLRVAVVGSGLAGLTVAHLLSSLHAENGQGEQGIEVELFEKAHKLGMVLILVSWVECSGTQLCLLDAVRHVFMDGGLCLTWR